MPEHSLEELQELSRPALRHAELIQIARTETPNKADEQASIRWPRRQAKATRFLAMLRRDHGSGAFEALVSQLEHARLNGSEHAQGDRIMLTFDSVYPVGVRHLFFYILRGGRRQTLEELQIVECRKDWRDIQHNVQVRDEFERLSLSQSQKEELVRRIISSMEEAAVSSPDLWILGSENVWAAALLAVREILPNDSELLRKVLLLAVLHMGGKAEHAGSFAQALGVTIGQENWNDIRKSLQSVIDYLFEQGCSEEEIAKTWEQMLIRRASQGLYTSHVFYWWKGLGRINETFRKPAARMCVEQDLSWYLEKPGSDLFGSHLGGIEPIGEGSLQQLQEMIHDSGDEWSGKQGLDMFEDKLVRCFARGQAAKACYFIAALYRYFGHCYVERSIMPKKQEVRDPIEKLMRVAIDTAQEENNFGVACALAEYLGEIETADQLREQARRLKQRVSLDCATYVFVDPLSFKRQ